MINWCYTALQQKMGEFVPFCYCGDTENTENKEHNNIPQTTKLQRFWKSQWFHTKSYALCSEYIKDNARQDLHWKRTKEMKDQMIACSRTIN